MTYSEVAGAISVQIGLIKKIGELFHLVLFDEHGNITGEVF